MCRTIYARRSVRVIPEVCPECGDLLQTDDGYARKRYVCRVCRLRYVYVPGDDYQGARTDIEDRVRLPDLLRRALEIAETDTMVHSGEIQARLGCSREWAHVVLQRLEATGQIKSRRFGRVHVFFFVTNKESVGICQVQT
jgi:hypothetical protein